MTRLILICAVFAAVLYVGENFGFDWNPAPTLKNCTRWAESQPGYSGNAVDNILHRDSLIRECMAR